MQQRHAPPQHRKRPNHIVECQCSVLCMGGGLGLLTCLGCGLMVCDDCYARCEGCRGGMCFFCCALCDLCDKILCASCAKDGFTSGEFETHTTTYLCTGKCSGLPAWS